LIYGLVFYGLSDVDVSIAKCLPQIPTEKLWTYCFANLVHCCTGSTINIIDRWPVKGV